MNGIRKLGPRLSRQCVWQIPLVFVGAWLAARLAARISPGAEHRIWVCALLAQIALPACPCAAIQFWSILKGLLSWGAADSAGEIRVVVSPAAAIASSSLHLPPLALAVLLAVCAIGVCYSAARLVWGLVKTRRILREATPLRLQGEHAACWSHARQNFAASLPPTRICPHRSLKEDCGARNRGIAHAPPPLRISCRIAGAGIRRAPRP